MSNIITFNLGGQSYSAEWMKIKRSQYLESKITRWSEKDKIPYINEDFTKFKHIWRLLLDPDYIFPRKYADLIDYYLINQPETIKIDKDRKKPEEFKILDNQIIFFGKEKESEIIDKNFLNYQYHNINGIVYNCSGSTSKYFYTEFRSDKNMLISAIYFGNIPEYSDLLDISAKYLNVWINRNSCVDISFDNRKDINIYYDIIKSPQKPSGRLKIPLPGNIAVSAGDYVKISVDIFLETSPNKNFSIFYSETDANEENRIFSSLNLSYRCAREMLLNISEIKCIFADKKTERLSIHIGKTTIDLNISLMIDIDSQTDNNTNYYKIPINPLEFADFAGELAKIESDSKFYVLSVKNLIKSAELS